MTSQLETPIEEMEAERDETQPDAPSEPPHTKGRRVVGGWWRFGLVVVAALVAIGGSMLWWQATHDDDRTTADTRDAVLIEARQNIEVMNTLDYREVDEGVKAWTEVTTGTLRDQLAGVSAEDRKLLAEQQKISVGRVVDAAVIDVDEDSATVIAAVEVSVQDASNPGSDPTVKRNRFTADLLRVGDRWKLESLQQVAVSLS